MIHHATVKKADKLAVTLTEVDYEGALAARAEDQRKVVKVPFTHSSAKVALAAMLLERTFRLEYPALYLSPSEAGWEVTHDNGSGEEPTVIYDGADVPDLANILTTCVDEGLDPEEGEAEDEKRGGSVVPEHYRQLYAERGNPRHCGDWIASRLEGIFEGPDRFEIDQFADFLADNGVVLEGPWSELRYSSQKGAPGRFRMSGRIKLERCLAYTGVMKFTSLGRADVKVPKDVLDQLRQRYHRAMTKHSHEVFATVRPDEVVECWDDVPKALQVELYRVLNEHGKPVPNREDSGPHDHVGHNSVRSLWRFFEPEDRMALNILAYNLK